MSESFLETIRAIDGEICHLSYHQKRYEDVLNSLGSYEIKDLKEYLNPPLSGIYRCRVIYTTSSVEVEYIKYIKKSISSIKLIYDDSIEYSKKSTNRDMIDRLYQMRDGSDEILIVKNSLITDTSIANIAFYDGEKWYTPSKPLLQGTTRQRVLDEGRIVTKDIEVKDLKNYSKVALLNAMIDFDIITKYNLKDLIC